MQKRKSSVLWHDKQHPFEKKRKIYTLIDYLATARYTCHGLTPVEADSSLSILKSHSFLQLIWNSFVPLESDFEIMLMFEIVDWLLCINGPVFTSFFYLKQHFKLPSKKAVKPEVILSACINPSKSAGLPFGLSIMYALHVCLAKPGL